MKFKARFDTLFGRLAVLIVAVLVLSHFSWLGILRSERRERQFQASVDQMAFQLQAFQAVADGRLHATLPDLLTETAGPPAGDALSASDKSAELARQLLRRLPAGSEVRLDSGTTPRVFVHLPHRDKWIAMPLLWVHAPPTVSAVVPGVMVVLAIAIAFSLFAAWQLQRPVRALARRRYVAPLKERGPYELRQLTDQFNRMAADLSAADEERNTMLAGIAHDLKTPLSRLRLRAEMLTDPKAGAGIERDVDSMSAIVEQFLAYAQSGDSEARDVMVDRHLRGLVQPFAEQGKHVALDLRAGDRFRLKPTHLERIVVNLLDNAFAYGAEPVRVATAADERSFTLTVEDHGAGIPQDAVDRVMRPFVRLDPARGGNAHCGLGLAIVDRLVRHLGGDLSIGQVDADAPQPGFRVTMRFPMPAATA
ncbi:ATP-binding protein [Ralstonia syzygii subsp. celebesensis]|uniref:histidine kinase n=2 Tax=Ralstonia syzygii subsp. celebesensis TaxID=1310168 RepID=A0A1U9VK93_9RALS|nr:ATP-binding protein [Ralstonia syzygii]AQW31114.1 two-component sensor histidine kinase [blood disease bacterium A2-HR MARDI]QQV55093.1 two-component sensor histidine kinase [Ralstonia syzygii subsp. celebesensis]